MSKTKKFLLFILVLPLLLLALNYSGFCFSQFRWLGDEEKLMRALAHYNGQTGHIVVDGVLRRRIPYKNAQEILDQNPGCCTVGSEAYSTDVGITKASFLLRIGGDASAVVSMKIKDRYLADNQEEKTTIVRRIMILKNCGQILSN